MSAWIMEWLRRWKAVDPSYERGPSDDPKRVRDWAPPPPRPPPPTAPKDETARQIHEGHAPRR